MTNISKKYLPEAQLHKLQEELTRTIGQLQTKEAGYFLEELLGEEERVMIAKRLGAIILLSQGHTIYKTAETLKLSTSTVSQYEEKLSKGLYQHITSVAKKNKKGISDFLDTLEWILHGGGIMPRRAGFDRYKGIL